MRLSVVYGRELDGEVTTFGTTGYTYNNTFLLYDRKSESVWYPYKSSAMNAVSGQSKGSAIPFLAEPDPLPLAEWRALHAESLVLVENE